MYGWILGWDSVQASPKIYAALFVWGMKSCNGFWKPWNQAAIETLKGMLLIGSIGPIIFLSRVFQVTNSFRPFIQGSETLLEWLMLDTYTKNVSVG